MDDVVQVLHEVSILFFGLSKGLFRSLTILDFGSQGSVCQDEFSGAFLHADFQVVADLFQLLTDAGVPEIAI